MKRAPKACPTPRSKYSRKKLSPKQKAYFGSTAEQKQYANLRK